MLISLYKDDSSHVGIVGEFGNTYVVSNHRGSHTELLHWRQALVRARTYHQMAPRDSSKTVRDNMPLALHAYALSWAGTVAQQRNEALSPSTSGALFREFYQNDEIGALLISQGERIELHLDGSKSIFLGKNQAREALRIAHNILIMPVSPQYQELAHHIIWAAMLILYGDETKTFNTENVS